MLFGNQLIKVLTIINLLLALGLSAGNYWTGNKLTTVLTSLVPAPRPPAATEALISANNSSSIISLLDLLSHIHVNGARITTLNFTGQDSKVKISLQAKALNQLHNYFSQILVQKEVPDLLQVLGVEFKAAGYKGTKAGNQKRSYISTFIEQAMQAQSANSTNTQDTYSCNLDLKLGAVQ